MVAVSREPGDRDRRIRASETVEEGLGQPFAGVGVDPEEQLRLDEFDFEQSERRAASGRVLEPLRLGPFDPVDASVQRHVAAAFGTHGVDDFAGSLP